jgi:hypothetical protein
VEVLYHWPVWAFLFLLIFLWLYHRQIGGLFTRKIKLGTSGIEVSGPAQDQAARETSPAERPETSAMLPDNRITKGNLEWIRGEMARRGLTESRQKEDYLLLTLAQAYTYRVFDTVWEIIFGSQIALLIKLNVAGVAGLDLDQGRAIYKAAADFEPDFFAKDTFERWFGFLEKAQLARQAEGKLYLTPEGRDFFHYLIDARRDPQRPH